MIGEIILQQLGGNQFAAMTGAKNFGTSGNDLSFKIGRNSNGVTHVKITLDPSDTYTVKFMRVRKFKVTELSTHSDIYCDMLREVFERNTGMYTSLTR